MSKQTIENIINRIEARTGIRLKYTHQEGGYRLENGKIGGYHNRGSLNVVDTFAEAFIAGFLVCENMKKEEIVNMVKSDKVQNIQDPDTFFGKEIKTYVD